MAQDQPVPMANAWNSGCSKDVDLLSIIPSSENVLDERDRMADTARGKSKVDLS
jgi:hypothetical protein